MSRFHAWGAILGLLGLITSPAVADDIPGVIQATKANFDSVVQSSPVPVFLVFVRSSSALTQKEDENIIRVASAYSRKIRFVEVDVDAAPEIAKGSRIETDVLPQVILEKVYDHKVIHRIRAKPLGYLGYNQLRSFIDVGLGRLAKVAVPAATSSAVIAPAAAPPSAVPAPAEVPAEAAPSPWGYPKPPAGAPCSRDIDCPGDDICESRQCVHP
jgi:hypothetical protein